MKTLRRAFASGAVAWAVVLPLATFAASRPHASVLVYASAVAVYAAGAIVCHQLPERSFHLWGAQMPVCARCVGIYVGAACGVAAGAVFGTRARSRSAEAVARRSAKAFALRRHAFALRHARLVVAAALAPTAATLLYEWTTGIMPSNWIRFAAGICLGAPIAAVILAATATPEREVN